MRISTASSPRLIVVRGFPAHVNASVLSIDVEFPVDVVRTIVWTDLASLLIFSTFVGAALYWRRRSDVHKRLMVLASMAILWRAGRHPPAPAARYRLSVLATT